MVHALYQMLLPGLMDRYRARVGEREYSSEEALFTSIVRQEHKEAFIEVRQRSDGRLVTLIEAISPANKITAEPTMINLPDIAPFDKSTVTKYEYRGPTVASDIDDYRIINGGHSVPGIEAEANQDINAYEVIWAFFQKHKLSDRQ